MTKGRVTLPSTCGLAWPRQDTLPDAARVDRHHGLPYFAAECFPEFAKEVLMFHERWIETLGEPIEENVALLRRLRASGKPVYALSNFARETFALAERKHGFLSEFDDRVISGHVGFVKPDAGIYEILFKRAGRRQNELLFIDDSPANVRASEALGMPAINYGPGVDLEKELKARGALP